MPGPFYFAWVTASETTFAPEHVREDEAIFDFKLTHTEGDFAQLQLQIENPRVGLLAPGRKLWAWFAYQRGSEVVPLFFGRLEGVPTDINQQVCTLNFIARPADFVQRQFDAAEPLKVRPYYDPIWFDPKDLANPNLVLEARSELWHIDRVTHEVTTSNIISGEDGTLAFDESNAFFDSVALEYGEPPVRRVEVIASVGWDQKAEDAQGIELSRHIWRAFSAIGSAMDVPSGIFSYTGRGLLADWPKVGANFGGGWTVTGGGFSPESPTPPREYLDKTEIRTKIKRRIGGVVDTSLDILSWQSDLDYVYGTTGPSVLGYNSPFMTWYNEWGLGRTTNPVNASCKIWFPRWEAIPSLKVGYNVSRTRKETVAFALEADVQSILVDPGEEDVIQLSMESAEVISPIDAPEDSSESSEAAPLMPIRDLRSSVYFSSARGTQSIEYLISVARAHLLARARAVSVTFETDFDRGVDSALSCRKSAVLEDYRLPGGIAGGKVKSYTLACDGESGKLSCSITIGCAIGRGNTVTGSDGTPSYVEEDYVEASYQFYENRFIVPIPGEVYYGSIEGLPSNDDGLNFFDLRSDDIVESVVVSGGAVEQEALMRVGGDRSDAPICFAKLNEAPTKITLTLKPVAGGPFQTDWEIETSALMVPRLIDLEAS